MTNRAITQYGPGDCLIPEFDTPTESELISEIMQELINEQMVVIKDTDIHLSDVQVEITNDIKTSELITDLLCDDSDLLDIAMKLKSHAKTIASNYISDRLPCMADLPSSRFKTTMEIH